MLSCQIVRCFHDKRLEEATARDDEAGSGLKYESPSWRSIKLRPLYEVGSNVVAEDRCDSVLLKSDHRL